MEDKTPILLDRNENQYGPAPACFDILRSADLNQLSLYSRDYARGRKSELSYRLSGEIGIPEERVLLSYGSEDMLKQVVHCYLRKGETLLLPSQSWWYYKSIASEVQGRHIEYALRERGKRWEFDAGEIRELYDRHRPQLILIASPNNPTGNTMPLEDLAAIIASCTNSVIVLDEAYFGFASESNDHINVLLDRHPRLVILRTFSKYYALAGLRIGYSAVSEDLGQLIAYSARYLGYNQLTEQIALAAMNDPEYYRDMARKMREDVQAYLAELSALEGFKPFESDANFLLVRYPAVRKQELQAGLKQRGVVVKFLDDPGLEDCIRITVGTQEQNRIVLEAFKDTVAAFPATTAGSTTAG